MNTPQTQPFRLAGILLIALSAAFFLNERPPSKKVAEHTIETKQHDASSSFISEAKISKARTIRAHKDQQLTALDDMLAGRPFVLVADGRPERFVLSLSEFYVPNAPG